MNKGNVIPVLECFACNNGFLRPSATEDLVRCPSCSQVVQCANLRVMGHVTQPNGSFLQAYSICLNELTPEQTNELRWQPSFYQVHTGSNPEDDLQTNLDRCSYSEVGSADELEERDHVARQVAEECPLLLDAAHLNIYRENSFRITGLAVDATPKEITRHADKLKLMEELGQGQAANTSAFALEPPPNLDTIREALQRLKEPERRLIDEFFWFWPAVFGDSKSDPAIQAMAHGKWSAAYDIWISKEQDPSQGHIATHNIAIIFHVIAIDWTLYHLAADVDPAKEAKIASYWREAFARWEKLASDERIWEALRARIRSLDDARLTTGLARRICAVLPNALDKINAEAALRFAEDRGRIDLAKLHINFMRDTHRGLDDVRETSELVLRPVRARVKQHIETAKEVVLKNPAMGADAAEELLEQCFPLSDLYELFHGKEAYQKTELFDEVAEATLDCLIPYQRKTEDNQRFVDLLQFAMSLATAIDIRQRIQESINIGEGNVRYKSLDPIYTRLQAIQKSPHAASGRLVELKRDVVPKLAEFAEREGGDCDLLKQLFDALAVVLRGISVDAHNNEQDSQTAREAIRLVQCNIEL
jgi:hypothetical protein